MGSDETAITIPGALEKLTFFTGTGRHRVQIAHFFRGLIGSRTPSGIGLGSGSPWDRIRRRCGSLVLSESPGSRCQVIRAKTPWAAERNRPKMLEAAAHAA